MCKEIKPTANFKIYGFMLAAGLTGPQLLCFALIHSFANKAQGQKLSIEYISSFTGLSRRTVINAINALTAAGYISKSRDKAGRIYCRYFAILNAENFEKLAEEAKEKAAEKIPVKGAPDALMQGARDAPKQKDLRCTSCTHEVHEMHTLGVPDALLNNKTIYKTINKTIYNVPFASENSKNETSKIEETASAKEPAKKPEKHFHGTLQNVLLTDQEFEQLKTKFPTDYTGRIDDLSYYVASTGKKYKSHYSTILNWDRMDKKRTGTQKAEVVAPLSADDQKAFDDIF